MIQFWNKKYTESAYVWTMFFVHLAYVAVFFGFMFSVPQFILTINFVIQMMICGFLMYKFNFFNNTSNISKLDKMLIFSSAFIIFTNIVLVELGKRSIFGLKISDGIKSVYTVLHIPIANKDSTTITTQPPEPTTLPIVISEFR